MTPPIGEMRDAIARYSSWQFQADIADDDPQAADSAQNAADRARADIQTFALASIAESLARLASTVSDEDTLSGRTVPVLLATNPFTY